MADDESLRSGYSLLTYMIVIGSTNSLTSAGICFEYGPVGGGGMMRRRGLAAEEVAGVSMAIDRDGFQLPCRTESSFIRIIYKKALEKDGAQLDMPEELYR